MEGNPGLLQEAVDRTLALNQVRPSSMTDAGDRETRHRLLVRARGGIEPSEGLEGDEGHGFHDLAVGQEAIEAAAFVVPWPHRFGKAEELAEKGVRLPDLRIELDHGGLPLQQDCSQVGPHGGNDRERGHDGVPWAETLPEPSPVG